MRLDLTILWFENQPDDIKTQLEEIEEHVREVGFVPQVNLQPDGRNLEVLSKQQQLFDDFDLVVVDYDLGQPGANGDRVAQQVRRGFGFTDIVFYSGQPTADLRRLVHENQIDGVYCVQRTQLAERLAVQIDQTVRRLSRLEAMQGLSVGSVSKCDTELRGILTEIHGSATEGQKATITAELDAIVANGLGHASKKYGECGTFEERLTARAVTSFHLQKLALSLLRGRTEFAEHRTLLKRYDAEVLRPRNTLGHATENRAERGWEVISTGTPAITASDFPVLRQSMHTHLQNLLAARELLQKQRTS